MAEEHNFKQQHRTNDQPEDYLINALISERHVRLEDVYKQAGGFGKYQYILYAAVLFIAFHEADITNINIVGGFQDHWCHVEELQNLTQDQQKYISIPFEDANVEYKKCEVYDVDYSTYTFENFLNWNRSVQLMNISTIRCKNWMYDTSTFRSTITSRYDLVCDRAWMISMVSTMFMCGSLFGGLIGGHLADRFGRKKTIVCGLALKVFVNILGVLHTHYAFLVFTRFTMGILNMICYVSAFVLVIEFVPEQWRNLAGAGLHISWGLGFMMWPILALGIRHEVTLQLTVVIPRLLFLGFYWVIDESPRWLLLKGRNDEANKLARKVASTNNNPLPDDFDLSSIQCESETDNEDITALFRSPGIRRLCLVQSFYWFSTNLIYYALSLNAGALSGNIFVNSILLGATDILGYVLSILMLAWSVTGRRLTSCLAMVCAGAASYVSVYFIINDIGFAHTIFAVAAKAFVTVAYSAIYIYTSEIFPSEVRNIGMGTCASIGKISGIVAPFVGGPLGRVWAPLPAIVYGTFGIACGLLILLQPETRNIPLFKSIEEVESYKKSRKMTAIEMNANTIDHSRLS